MRRARHCGSSRAAPYPAGTQMSKVDELASPVDGTEAFRGRRSRRRSNSSLCGTAFPVGGDVAATGAGWRRPQFCKVSIPSGALGASQVTGPFSSGRVACGAGDKTHRVFVVNQQSCQSAILSVSNVVTRQFCHSETLPLSNLGGLDASMRCQGRGNRLEQQPACVDAAV